jgi:hypothetical protein
LLGFPLLLLIAFPTGLIAFMFTLWKPYKEGKIFVLYFAFVLFAWLLLRLLSTAA